MELWLQEMHTARLLEAVREKRPFSIWRIGELFGTTFYPPAQGESLPLTSESQ